jgi:hypothetical protein
MGDGYFRVDEYSESKKSSAHHISSGKDAGYFWPPPLRKDYSPVLFELMIDKPHADEVRGALTEGQYYFGYAANTHITNGGEKYRDAGLQVKYGDSEKCAHLSTFIKSMQELDGRDKAQTFLFPGSGVDGEQMARMLGLPITLLKVGADGSIMRTSHGEAASGPTMTIVNATLAHDDFIKLAQNSRDVVMATGDQSLLEMLSLEKHVVYQATNSSKIAVAKSLIPSSENRLFYENNVPKPTALAQALRTAREHPDFEHIQKLRQTQNLDANIRRWVVPAPTQSRPWWWRFLH